MKKVHFCPHLSQLLFIVGLIASCQAQNKTAPPGGSKNQPPPTENMLPKYDPYFIESEAITTDHGPSSITRNIMQDRNGNIWLATWEGIIRYDPASGGFTNFTNKEELKRFHVFAVLEDSKGNLWFGTIGAGVYRYDASSADRQGNTFTNFTTQEGLVNDRVGCIYEDSKGNIWIGTEGGVSRYDASSADRQGKIFTNFTTADGLSNNDINSIIEDKNGKLWFGARGNASWYDALPAGGQGTSFTEITNLSGAPFVNVRSIIKDKNGHIWLGGNDGLWRFDGMFFTNYTQDFVGYIYEDKQGNIWTSSETSADRNKWVLSRYDEKSLYDNSAKPTQIWEQAGMFFGILEDKDGGIWLGTLNGVCRYDGQSFNCFQE